MAAAGFGASRARAADKVPVLGLIFPPLDRGVPEEGLAMYGDTLRYVVTGLGIEAIADVDSVTQNDLIEFGVRVRESAPDADSLLVSCGGFRTLEIIAPIEARTGVPVISSMPHGLWAGARLVGLSGTAPGFGTLLSKQHA